MNKNKDTKQSAQYNSTLQIPQSSQAIVSSFKLSVVFWDLSYLVYNCKGSAIENHYFYKKKVYAF